MGNAVTTTRYCVPERVKGGLDNAVETPQPPSSTQVCWPINCPQGIKPLQTVIVFADPITDPIGCWENHINWWSYPLTEEYREQVTFVLKVGADTPQFWFMVKTWHAPRWSEMELVDLWGLTSGGPAYPRHRACWWGCWQFSALTGWLLRDLCV